jgi:hypothetical protein
MSKIPQDDRVVVGVDLPESYTLWTKAGSTQLSGWSKAVEMTFNFDFTGVPLERVFELAVGALVIDRRSALKKEGFEFCRDNPVVECRVAELKTKGPAQPRNAAQVKGDLKLLKKTMSPEAYKAYLAELVAEMEESEDGDEA